MLWCVSFKVQRSVFFSMMPVGASGGVISVTRKKSQGEAKKKNTVSVRESISLFLFPPLSPPLFLFLSLLL